MKLLAVLLATVVLAQAAQIPKLSDFSKYQPRSVLFPRSTPPKYQSDNYVPVMAGDFKAACGVKPTVSSSRITGNDAIEATPHEFPWQVAVFIDDLYFCGGSLISDRHVLTAAHCADGALSFVVYLGAHDVRNKTDVHIEVTSTVFKVHENWRPNLIQNDIAVITLPSAVTFTNTVSPICLEAAGEPVDKFVDVPLEVTGWGKPSDGASGISPVLRKVTTNGISNTVCANTFGATITDKNICIGTANKNSACNGDSGGPLGKDINGSFTEVGIVSFGSSAGCEQGYPAVFTRVSAFRDWISTNFGI